MIADGLILSFAVSFHSVQLSLISGVISVYSLAKLTQKIDRILPILYHFLVKREVLVAR